MEKIKKIKNKLIFALATIALLAPNCNAENAAYTWTSTIFTPIWNYFTPDKKAAFVADAINIGVPLVATGILAGAGFWWARGIINKQNEKIAQVERSVKILQSQQKNAQNAISKIKSQFVKVQSDINRLQSYKKNHEGWLRAHNELFGDIDQSLLEKERKITDIQKAVEIQQKQINGIFDMLDPNKSKTVTSISDFSNPD